MYKGAVMLLIGFTSWLTAPFILYDNKHN